MIGLKLLYAAAALLLSAGLCQSELLTNSNFESQLTGAWWCNYCKGTIVGDAKSGKGSLRATARTAVWQGPWFSLGKKLHEGHKYLLDGYVKILPSIQNQPPQPVRVTISYKKTDGKSDYAGVVSLKDVSPADGWVRTTSRFQTPTSLGDPYVETWLYIEGPQAGVNFQVDDFSITEASDPNEILFNPDFELPLGTADNWICNGGCTGALVKDAHAGNTAYLTSARTMEWMGPFQTLPFGKKVFAGRSYIISGYVKVKQSVKNQKPQRISVTVSYKKADGTYEYTGVAAVSNVLPSAGWVNIVSDFTTLKVGQKEMFIYIEGPEPGIDFLVDSFSLKGISTSDSWKISAKKRINSSMRKGILNVALTSSTSRKVTIEIKQLKHEFGFGSAISARTLQTNKKYRKWYMDNFEWAVVENDMKWRAAEPKEGAYRWSSADTALDLLEANNKTVRGHAIIWAGKKFNPDWVQKITDPGTLYKAAMKRVKTCLTHFKGRLVHWDVNNEMIANRFFLDGYNKNPKIRYDMFHTAKRVDPSAKLFLNDYSVVANGYQTSMYIAQAKEFLAAGVPVEGMGVQSHLSGRPYGSELLNRLDRLSAAGLPIWVTELDYVNADPKVRAEVLEEALLAYFSHPNVHGILFWGFWESRHWKGSEAALVNGPDMTENAAGLMWKRLFHNDWRSSMTLVQDLSAGVTSKVTEKVFYGSYRITIKAANGFKLGSRIIDVSKRIGSANILFDI